MIRFQCTSCGKSYGVPSDYAGRAVKCKNCGTRLRVPVPAAESVRLAGDEPGDLDLEAAAADVLGPEPSPASPPVADVAETNPYRAPETEAGPSLTGDRERWVDSKPLASRWARLGAVLLNNLFAIILFVPFFIGIEVVDDPGAEALGIGLMVSAFLLEIVLLIWNIVWLVQRGQSVGKAIVGIRVVDYRTDEIPGFSKIFLIREFVPALLNQLTSIFGLVDALFIFGAEKRCLHDLMAGTKVVVA